MRMVLECLHVSFKDESKSLKDLFKRSVIFIRPRTVMPSITVIVVPVCAY